MSRFLFAEEEMLNQYLEQGEVEVSQIAEKQREKDFPVCVWVGTADGRR